MPILFFDTETTGLPDYRLTNCDERQPHLVQMAAILMDDDATERASVSMIVDPNVSIPEEASRVHGITKVVANRFGLMPATAVAMFDRLAERADTIVAHNIKFDWTVMAAAWARLNRPWTLHDRHGSRARFCTMEAAAPIVNLPPTDRMRAAGFNKPKPPKLEECIRHFFDEPLDGAHDALVDVRACARLFWHLKSMEAAHAA